MIRTATQNDIQAITDIYNHYVLNSVVTFDEFAFPPRTIGDRIAGADPKHPWLVYVQNNEIIAYAYAGVWKPRSAYKTTAEVTVYLKDGCGGKGIGTELYSELISQLKANGMHSLIGGITIPNPGSIALHEKFGFKKVALFSEVGFKFDKCLDVGYWELILNR